MENLKTPKGFLKKGTAQFGITGGVNFSGLTTLPIFQNELTNDSTGITKLSNTKIKLTAGKKYKISMSIYSDGSTGEYFSLYNFTNSTSLASLGRGIFGSLSAGKGLEVILTPDIDTIIECRADSARGTTQYEWKTNIEEIEANLLPIPNILNQMLGVNQTRQDVKTSRALGTTYTNTTGKPIQVNVIATGTGAGTIIAVIGGVAIYGSGDTVLGSNLYISFVVPNNTSYSIKTGAYTFKQWAELR